MKRLIFIICLLTVFGSCTKTRNATTNPNPNPNPNNPINTGINIKGPDVRDIDGNIYTSVTNCSKTWMQKNLNVSRYKNGDLIPEVQSVSWWRLTSGAWCYYNNDPANGEKYGKLYNWYAVNDPRGLAPEGWHVPTVSELNSLINCLGGRSIAGGAMKEVGFTNWVSPNTGATNSSGFTALPGSGRDEDGNFIRTLGGSSFWWTSDQSGNYGYASFFLISTQFKHVSGDVSLKSGGFYVRCVKN
jgi:uncharacterized protein (TIGR02145 family)